MNLDLIYDFSKNKLNDETTGHDWHHALRVENNALLIGSNQLSEKELKIVKSSSWLHDTIDPKISNSKKTTINDIKMLLKKANASEDEIKEIIYTIQNLSYSKNINKKIKLSPLGEIVQDADRLDAIGAIGIARTFYYGGSKGHSLYSQKKERAIEDINEENYREQDSIINHFYEKLLLLEESMNTDQAKKIAHERTEFMILFLEKFNQEIANRD